MYICSALSNDRKAKTEHFFEISHMASLKYDLFNSILKDYVLHYIPRMDS